jgi:hypothetical protein
LVRLDRRRETLEERAALQSSIVRFSIGVPESKTEKPAVKPRAALQRAVSAFFAICASS